MFSGSIPALVTPFKDGKFDEQTYRRLIDWQIEQGSSGLVPCGTTGEASTLSIEEHHRVVEVCIDQAAGRVPVIAGCGSNDTQNALAHMRFCKEAGAAAGLCVAPYYNRPSQTGLIAHFSYLAENSDLPIVLYNVPSRTVTDIEDETVVELVRKYPGDWELYDMEADRTELHDLAPSERDRVKAMVAMYDDWAVRCGVIPREQILRVMADRNENAFWEKEDQA